MLYQSETYDCMNGSWILVWSAVHDQSGFQHPMSQWGLMGSFGLCLGRGEACLSNDEGVLISDFQMLADVIMV